MKIGAIDRHSDKDFPGKSATVLYAVGCNMRCPFCFKEELIGGCHSDGVEVSEQEVFTWLERSRQRIDSVVFSGGEPTLHDDLPQWMARVRAMGYLIKLDTNGTQPAMLRFLMAEGLLDYIAMDVKAPLENYAAVTGQRVNVDDIRTSIWLVKNSGIAHEFRTTVVPGLHTIRELKSIAELLHGADCYVLQDFDSARTLRPDLTGRPSFARKPLEDMRAFVEKRVKRFEVRHCAEVPHMPVLSRRQPAGVVCG
jgi:pyruvate formate lyase activating enzyme